MIRREILGLAAQVPRVRRSAHNDAAPFHRQGASLRPLSAAGGRRLTSTKRTSSRFVRRLERAIDLGQNPVAHGQDGPEGQP